jgi:ferrous iron transport protein A
MLLHELKIGESAVVKSIEHGKSSLRIMEMGIVAGVKIKTLSKAPMGDPIAFEVHDTVISLRKSDANLVVLHT